MARAPSRRAADGRPAGRAAVRRGGSRGGLGICRGGSTVDLRGDVPQFVDEYVELCRLCDVLGGKSGSVEHVGEHVGRVGFGVLMDPGDESVGEVIVAEAMESDSGRCGTVMTQNGEMFLAQPPPWFDEVVAADVERSVAQRTGRQARATPPSGRTTSPSRRPGPQQHACSAWPPRPNLRVFEPRCRAARRAPRPLADCAALERRVRTIGADRPRAANGRRERVHGSRTIRRSNGRWAARR